MALRLVAAGALAVALGGGALALPSHGTALSFEGQEARLARELREGVSAQRIVAASELATLSPTAAWPLIELALRDPQIEVRRHAAEAAAMLGLREAVERTRPWLESDDPDLREIAVRTEGALGDATSVAGLARALGDARFSVRAAAAESLGRLGLEAAAAPLGTALEDTDATVRVVAAEALGHTPGPEATRLLLTRSLDAVLEVRVAIVEALARRGEVDGEGASSDGRTTAVLVGALADDAREVRVAAIVGLARARHAPAVPWLARILDEAPVPGRTARATDETREVRAAAAALGRIDSDAARASLVRALARGVAPVAVLDALRAQHDLAPEPTEGALAQGLAAPGAREVPAGSQQLVEGIVALAPLRGGEPLVRPLLALLREREVPTSLVLRALGATLAPRATASASTSATDEEAMVALLSAVEDRDTADAAIDGLRHAAARGALDPRAVEALLSAIEERLDARVIELLGRFDDARAMPRLLEASRERSGPMRRAALVALARATHLDAEARHELLGSVVGHLSAADAEERLAIRAIAVRHGDDVALGAVLDALATGAPIDRATAIELIASMLVRSADPGLRARAERVLVGALASIDSELSSAAAAAILGGEPAALVELVAAAAARVTTDPRLGDPLALARAARASGCETSGCLTLRARDPEHELELGAGGSSRELLADELRFPRSVARSFALLHAARRDILGAEAIPQLCRLAARREPGVRANAGLALAHLGARCDGIDPTLWIAGARSVAVQTSGARWCAALGARDVGDRCDPRRLAQAATRCLETAVDPSLVAACGALARTDAASMPSPERDALVDLTVVGPTGRPTPRRLVSIRFADGATLVVPTDDAGRVALRVDRVPGLDGASPWVEDPYATVLER